MEIKVGEIIRAKREEKNISLSDFQRNWIFHLDTCRRLKTALKRIPILKFF